MRLRTLLLLLLFGLGLLPAAVLTALDLPATVATFEEAAAREALSRGEAAAAELNRRMERRKETVRNLAMLPAPLEMLNASRGKGDGLYLDVRQAEERFSGVVRRWFGGASDFRRLAILDREGTELLRLEAAGREIAPAGTTPSLATEFPERFAAMVAGNAREPRAMLVSSSLRVRVAGPIRSLDGLVVGVLVTEFDLHDVFGTSAGSVLFDGTGRVLLGDPAGVVSPFEAGGRSSRIRDEDGDLVVTRSAAGDAVAWTLIRFDERPEDALWIGTALDRSRLGDWLADLRLRVAAVALALTLILALVVRFVAVRVDGARQRLLGGLAGILRGEEVAFSWSWPREARLLAEELNALAVRHGDATRARAAAEEQLFREKEQAEATLLSIADGVLTTDAEGRVRYANPAAVRLLNRRMEDIRGQMVDHVLILVDEAHHTPLPDPAIACLQGARVADAGAETLLVRPDGQPVAVEVTAAPMHDRQGGIVGAVVALRNVAKERQLGRMLAYQAAHDPLTGLMNRRAFEERLKAALAEAQDGDGQAQWLCYVDLDQFKLINDTCGHLAGDELLKQVAAELKCCARDGDLVARTGGDEFSVLTHPASRDSAYELADRMRRALTDLHFVWQSQSFSTSGSFGLVPVRQRSGSLYDLMSAADRACYVAKDRGRNRIHVADSQDEATRRIGSEMRWVHETIRALEQDRLLLYWQPFRPLRPPFDEVHGEILVRMRAEDGSIVPPGAFIPAAERYNLMRDVDRWIVSRVLASLAAGGVAGATVSVNLSAQSLCDDDFLGFVLSALDSTGVDPRLLCFEVTETAAMSNLTRARQMIEALKGRGCRFSLDDFGSGLSSFAYLKNLPVDYLKIDGSFVRHIVEDRLDRAFVQSINDIGHLMGIETIAEYVETPAIEAVLRDLGVDFAQGYAVARPAPWDAAPVAVPA
ncbi:EAL domain-containing protein [Azospirillum thermophilum]|nr:EAL domain-containing protein [Azospirillum thermophilum]